MTEEYNRDRRDLELTQEELLKEPVVFFSVFVFNNDLGNGHEEIPNFCILDYYILSIRGHTIYTEYF